MRSAVAVVIISFLAAACAQSPEEESRGTGRKTKSPSRAPSSSTAAGTAGTTPDLFQPVVLDRPPGGDEKSFYRADDGTTLAVLNYVGSHPNMRTRYRIYGPGWKPRTALLQVPGVLEIMGPVTGGFLGHSFILNRDASPRVSAYILLRPDGTLRRVPVVKESTTLRRTDEVLWTMSGKLAAYRPSAGQIHPVRYAQAKLPRYAAGAFDTSTGEGCALAYGRRDEPLVYWTTDSGHSWQHMPTDQLLGLRLGADMCEPAGAGRLVLVSSYPPTGYARASTVDLTTRRVTSSYRLDKRFMLEENWMSPVVVKGRLVFPTLRSGLMVATDRNNAQFVYRPAPVERRTLVEAVGGELVNQNWGGRRDVLDVSSDVGRTWHTVDLKAGDWTATG